MGVRFASQFSTAQVNPLPVGNTQTLVYSTPALITAADNAIVLIAWFLDITAGASTTILAVTLYRGVYPLATSLPAGNWYQSVTPPNSYILSGSYSDQPGGVDMQYSLTVSQLSSTGAGTLNDGCLLAYVL